MSDASQRLPEIMNIFKCKGHYFCVVCCGREGQLRYLRFGVSKAGYEALQNALQIRPFDRMPGLKYLYFAEGGGGGSPPEMFIRIELNHQGKNFSIPAPKNLVANLKWLVQLRDWDKAAYLAITPDVAEKREITWTELLRHKLAGILHK